MKKYVHILVITVVLLLAASFCVSAAAGGIYVNDGSSVLTAGAGNVWVLGGSGAFPQSISGAYVLSAEGLTTLSGLPSSSGAGTGATGGNVGGGGGLRHTDGRVALPASRLLVGLRYYYSSSRDSSVDSALLENIGGGGFVLGYLDSARRFVSYGEGFTIAAARIVLRPAGNGCIDVCDEAGQLLWSSPSTDRETYLAVHPLPHNGTSLCRYSGSRYTGDFAFADLGNRRLTVVNAVDMESYVIGVCAGEMGTSFPLEALKAQAVAARTYAMFNVQSRTYYNACGFDLTADTYSQVYLGYFEDAALTAAAQQTENQYLTYDGRLIDALFFSADGGETLDSELVFSSALPYLRGYPDPYEGSAWTQGALGHRVGMSQWGAYAMAKYYSFNYGEILGFYYTGVGLSYGY